MKEVLYNLSDFYKIWSNTFWWTLLFGSYSSTRFVVKPEGISNVFLTIFWGQWSLGLGGWEAPEFNPQQIEHWYIDISLRAEAQAGNPPSRTSQKIKIWIDIKNWIIKYRFNFWFWTSVLFNAFTINNTRIHEKIIYNKNWRYCHSSHNNGRWTQANVTLWSCHSPEDGLKTKLLWWYTVIICVEMGSCWHHCSFSRCC